MSDTVDHRAYLAATNAKPTLSEQFADAVTGSMGSWKFVIGQTLVMAAWIAVNTTNVLPMIPQFDPSLILLNLALSTEAALGASFILMSQNRQSEKDRLTVKHDLEVDMSAERMLEAIDKKLDFLLSILSPEQLKAIGANDESDDAPAKPADNGKPSLRERFSDAVTRGMGSWKFVIGHSLLMAGWIALNTTNIAPFIPKFDAGLTLLNLALSTEAAFAGAFILMSQNRQGERDRKTGQHDLQVDLAAARKVMAIDKKIDAILCILTPEQLKIFAASRAAAQATANANATATAEPVAAPAASTNDNNGDDKPKAVVAPQPQRAAQAPKKA